MREGNSLFMTAQKHHASIMKQREELSLGNSSVSDCYQGIGVYLAVLCNALQYKTKTCLVDTVAVLQKNGVDLGEHAFEHACVLEAVHKNSSAQIQEIINKVVYAYLTMRSAILEYLLDKFEPEYKDGCVIHFPTGVVLEATEFAYKYTLESYYDI